MHRQALLERLGEHRTRDPAEERSLRRIVAFVESHARCFERGLAIGHVTGSAWLLDPSGDRVLLTEHRKLRRWLQLGGHADGQPNVLEVALREAREESGIDSIVPVCETIFDVDVHRIPAREGEVEHDHYDVCFLLRVLGSTRFRVSRESLSLAWVSRTELPLLDVDASVLRKHRKWTRSDRGSQVRGSQVRESQTHGNQPNRSALV